MKIDIVFDEGHNYERIECSSISSTSDYVAFYDDNDCLIAVKIVDFAVFRKDDIRIFWLNPHLPAMPFGQLI